ncbi:hypothetical protein Tco_1343228 [Tanacetum coccineum]
MPLCNEKPNTPRSCLRWKPTGKIFKTVGLRLVPTGKIFSSSTTKVDSEHQNGSNKDITNTYEYEQTLNIATRTPMNKEMVRFENAYILEMFLQEIQSFDLKKRKVCDASVRFSLALEEKFSNI